MVQEHEIRVINYESVHKDIKRVVLDGPKRELRLEIGNLQKAEEMRSSLESTLEGFERMERRERTGSGNWGLKISREESQIVFSGSLSLGLRLLKSKDLVLSTSEIYWKLLDDISILNGIDFNRMFDGVTEAAEADEARESAMQKRPYSPTFLGAPDTCKKLGGEGSGNNEFEDDKAVHTGPDNK